MKVRRKLLELARIVADQAERDPEFAERLTAFLGFEQSQRKKRSAQSSAASRPKNRRCAAILDPVAVIREEGEDVLRSRLSELSLDQIRDIVADHSMDPDKKAMTWKDTKRVVERIVQIALNRSQKGDAFRAD